MSLSERVLPYQNLKMYNYINYYIIIYLFYCLNNYNKQQKYYIKRNSSNKYKKYFHNYLYILNKTFLSSNIIQILEVKLFSLVKDKE